MQRAVDTLATSLDEGLSSSQSSSVGHRTGRLVADQFDSLISNVRENPSRGSENEQIRILLERQKEQILADCQAEIQKHDFQRGEIYRDEIHNFFTNNYLNKIGIFVMLVRKVSMRWKN